jgi:site-specific recombinase XerD
MNSEASNFRSPAIPTSFDAAWVAQRLGEVPSKTQEYVCLYLAGLEQQGQRHDTLEHRGYTLIRFLRWLPADQQGDLVRVSATDVDRFLDEQRAQGRQANTILTYLATLRGFFRFLIAEGVVVHSPLPPQRPRGRCGEVRPIPAVPKANVVDSPSVDWVAARLEKASAATQEWVRCYLAMLKRRGRKADTVEQHRCSVTRFIASLPLSHQADLSLVLPADVSRFVDELQTQGRHPNTILTYLSPLNSFFEFLLEEGVVNRSPVQRRHYPQRPDTLPRAMREDEVSCWLRVLTKPLEQAIFLLLLRSGVRIGEVVTLNRADVDVERCTLYIRTGNKNGLGRVTYFSSDAQEALRRWLVVRAECPGEEALFIRRQRRVTPDWIRERFKDSLRRAGLPLLYRVHDLRHTYATLLLNAGMPITTLQKLLGHDRIATTLLYARLSDATKRAHYFTAMQEVQDRTPLAVVAELEGDDVNIIAT